MFKKDFIWATATAAYQVEGAAYEDGRGLSVWDTFCKEPNRIFEGHSGDVACDHYHRFDEDFRLMASLGMRHYRFSFSWTRLIPDGDGAVNPLGVAYYNRLINSMLENGITPYATLFHWDYPHALFKKGGWLNDDSPEWFARYTEVIARSFGDRVKFFYTLNEPQCFIGLSYVKTVHAPGIAFPTRDTLQMSHNVLLAHGRAVQVLRHEVPNCKVGYAPTAGFFIPATDSHDDIEAARIATFDATPDNWSFNAAWWSDPVMLGHYPQRCVEQLGGLMPTIKTGDMELISQPIDIYGQNVYQAAPVESDGNGGYRMTARSVGHAKTAIGWPITPEVMHYTPKFLYERYKAPIHITENGLSCHDVVSLDGKVHDPNRIDYIHRGLLELSKAIDEGVDVTGYFHWSFMDNFEWASGYDDRFGLVYVDYTTQQRIPKDSAEFYKGIIATNGKKL